MSALANMPIVAAASPVVGREKTTQSARMGLVGDVLVGTPPQTLTVEFHTDSVDFWVVGADCNDDQCKQSSIFDYTRKRFDTKSSSTYAAANPAKPFTSYYGNGTTGSDLFSINGGDAWKNVSGMTLEVITQSSSRELKWHPSDGVFGLGLTRASGSDPNTLSSLPLDQLLKVADQKVYTVYMQPVSDSSTDGVGQLTIGAVDSDNCNGTWYYTNIPKGQQEWSLDGVTAKCGDDLNTTVGSSATFDPSIPFIFAPENLVMGIVKKANAKFSPWDDFMVDCGVELPSLDLTINGNTFSIPSSQYILKLSGGSCKLALIPIPAEWGYWIGAPFYRSYCVLHDVGQTRMGMANLLQPNSAVFLKMGSLNLVMSGLVAFLAYFMNTFRV